MLRNGIRIGSPALAVADDFAFHGSIVFLMMTGTEDAASPLDPTRKRHRWTSHSGTWQPFGSLDGRVGSQAQGAG